MRSYEAEGTVTASRIIGCNVNVSLVLIDGHTHYKISGSGAAELHKRIGDMSLVTKPVGGWRIYTASQSVICA